MLCFVFLALGWPRFLPGRRVKDAFAALESPSFVVFLACARLRWPPRLRSAQRGHARERAARAARRAGPPRTVERLLARRRPPPPAPPPPPPPLLPPRVVCGIPGGTEGVLPGPGPDRQLGGRERGCSQACARGRRLRSSPRARARPEDPRSAWALSGRGLGLGRARGGGGGGSAGWGGGTPGPQAARASPEAPRPRSLLFPSPAPLPSSVQPGPDANRGPASGTVQLGGSRARCPRASCEAWPGEGGAWGAWGSPAGGGGGGDREGARDNELGSCAPRPPLAGRAGPPAGMMGRMAEPGVPLL